MRILTLRRQKRHLFGPPVSDGLKWVRIIQYRTEFQEASTFFAAARASSRRGVEGVDIKGSQEGRDCCNSEGTGACKRNPVLFLKLRNALVAEPEPTTSRFLPQALHLDLHISPHDTARRDHRDV